MFEYDVLSKCLVKLHVFILAESSCALLNDAKMIGLQEKYLKWGKTSDNSHSCSFWPELSRDDDGPIGL